MNVNLESKNMNENEIDILDIPDCPIPKEKIRKALLSIEERIKEIPGSVIGDSDMCPLKHTFVDGAYIREIFMPKGILLTSKIHKIAHPYFILKGDVSVITEEGLKRIKAPFYGVTPVGTKRLLYIHEDTTWVTVHVTKEKNLEKIEEEIIAKTFDLLPNNVIDVLAMEENHEHKEISKDDR